MLQSPVSLKRHVSHHFCCQFTCVARFHAAKRMFFKHDALHSFCCQIISVTMHIIHVKMEQVVLFTCTCGSNAQVEAVLLSTFFYLCHGGWACQKKEKGRNPAETTASCGSRTNEERSSRFADDVLCPKHIVGQHMSQHSPSFVARFRMPDLERISVIEHGKNLHRSTDTRLANLSTWHKQGMHLRIYVNMVTCKFVELIPHVKHT